MELTFISQLKTYQESLINLNLTTLLTLSELVLIQCSLLVLDSMMQDFLLLNQNPQVAITFS